MGVWFCVCLQTIFFVDSSEACVTDLMHCLRDIAALVTVNLKPLQRTITYKHCSELLIYTVTRNHYLKPLVQSCYWKTLNFASDY